MAETFVERLLGAPAGSVATVEPDYMVVNDGVSHGTVDLVKTVAHPRRVLVVFDHDVPTGSPEAAAVFGKISRFAGKHGLRFIQAQGVGYSYLLASLVKPGQVVVTGGSHSAIFGAVGALGLNLSNSELARAIETGRYSVVVPQTVRVSVRGKLRDGVHMMDAALHFLAQNKDLAGKALEFAGELTPQQAAVLCSMACGTGALTASFAPGAGAGGLELDLSGVEPMAVMPCDTRESQQAAPIRALDAVAGTVFQAGQIGGYTGGSIEDLRLAAAMSKSRKLALGFRLTVCPATSADYIAAAREGVLETLIDYGAQIHAAGDHSVNTQGAGVIGNGERLLTTGLYTFSGCMGCQDSQVYTASVQTIMKASAAMGV